MRPRQPDLSTVPLARLPKHWRKRFIEAITNNLLKMRTKRVRLRRVNPYSKAEMDRQRDLEFDRQQETIRILTNLLSGRAAYGEQPEGGPIYVTDETTQPQRVFLYESVWDLDIGRSVLALDANQADWEAGRLGHLEIRPGIAFRIKLPDGAWIDIEESGSFTVNRPDTPTPIYGPPDILPFNPFVNASDRLSDFLEEMGSRGISQKQMLELPVEAFIYWLIEQAARRDGLTPGRNASGDDQFPEVGDHPAVAALTAWGADPSPDEPK